MDPTPHEGAEKPTSTLPATTNEQDIAKSGGEENGVTTENGFEESPAKRVKLDSSNEASQQGPNAAPQRKKGTAPVKQEYLITVSQVSNRPQRSSVRDDDAAEAAHHEEGGGEQKRQKKKGQNTKRNFGNSQDEIPLCHSIMHSPEFSPGECKFGEKCKYEHDLRRYLKEHKREDLTTLGGVCPVWKAFGKCSSGWKCRFVGSHMTEVEREGGRKELVLLEDESRREQQPVKGIGADGVANTVSPAEKLALQKRKYQTPKADQYVSWLDKTAKEIDQAYKEGRITEYMKGDNGQQDTDMDAKEKVEENRAQFTEPPFYPSEKRRVYFGPETPVLAPLTTQGNLPFRRLCSELGAQFTYSEMAMSLPLIQGQRSEWALMKAHESEIVPPTVKPGKSVVKDYDNSRDLKFGAQIAANKPWQAIKATEIMTALCPHLRVIDLNCGCPIDLVYREGAGSALLDHPSKLEKILRGMNAVSTDVPVTAKIRMGTKDNYPTALKLADRLVMGGPEAHRMGLGPPGIAALTLHGRSRQQRYTRSADWEYISQCSALIKRLNEQQDNVTDTVREPDERLQPASGKVFFLGNGDCYSYESYYNAIRDSGVDSVMIARGALVKPWIFEEIQAGQYLDKSASERLGLIEKFVKYGLEAWGSDEQGVGTTRRFLLELLSFTHRYVPVGLLEYLPPNLQDRPPLYRGRNEMETLLASDNYKDWIKISEMFLGPAHKDFKFEPKHKSNSYEIEAEG